MKSVLKVNGIASLARSRLIQSGVLSESMTADVAYLRLRSHYGHAPLSIYGVYGDKTSLVEPMDFLELSDKLKPLEIVISIQAVCELTGANDKDIRSVLRLFDSELVSFIEHDSPLWGLKGEFYSSKEMSSALKVAHNKKFLRNAARRHVSKLVKGMSLLHPKGEAGYESAKDLFERVSKDALFPSKKELPLTYANLDYSKIDWAIASTHESFDDIQILRECPDRGYLIKYLITPLDMRTPEFLTDLARTANMGGSYYDSKFYLEGISTPTSPAPKT